MAEKPNSTEKSASSKINVDVRLCKDCKATLFSRRDFEEERLQKPNVTRSYDNLVQFERGIRLLQPRFQKLLSALQLVLNVYVIVRGTSTYILC